MDFLEILQILGVLGGSANIGLLIRCIFLWITRKNPIEDYKDWDPKTGKLIKHHQRYRNW